MGCSGRKNGNCNIGIVIMEFRNDTPYNDLGLLKLDLFVFRCDVDE